MLKFYYNTAPNPMKVALYLEESGIPYEPVPIDTRKGRAAQGGLSRDQSECEIARDPR